MTKTTSRIGRVIGWLVFFGVVMVFAGFVGGSSFGKSSWRGILLWASILFAFGVWAGFVLISKSDAWLPRYRRWLHSLTLVVLACAVASTVANPSVDEFLLVSGITAIIGYFGEFWVERL
jgi:hypothetical protein